MVGKKVTESYILCFEFLKENFSETIRYIRLNFLEIIEIVIFFSTFRDFILLASSDNDKHILMRQKMSTKIDLYEREPLQRSELTYSAVVSL